MPTKIYNRVRTVSFWVSSNPAVATVSRGQVTAVGLDQTQITASVNDPISGMVTSGVVTVTVTRR